MGIDLSLLVAMARSVRLSARMGCCGQVALLLVAAAMQEKVHAAGALDKGWYAYSDVADRPARS